MAEKLEKIYHQAFDALADKSQQSRFVKDNLKEMYSIYGPSTRRKITATQIESRKDFETLASELQQAKRLNNELKSSKKIIVAKLRYMEEELVRKDSLYAEALSNNAFVAGSTGAAEKIRRQDLKIRSLKNLVADKDKAIGRLSDEIEKLKDNIRFTRVYELEAELKTYYRETVRLKRMIEHQIGGVPDFSSLLLKNNESSPISIEKLKVELVEKDSKISSLENHIKIILTDKEESNRSFTGKFSELNAQPDDKNANGLVKKFASLERAIDSSSKEIMPKNRGIEMLKDDLSGSQRQMQQLMEKITLKDERLAANDTIIKELRHKNDINELKNEETVQKYRKQIQDLEQNIVFLNQTIQQLREKESTSNKVVESLQKQLQEVLDNQERTLEDRVVYEASIRSRSRSVNSINNSLLNSYRSLAPALASQGQSPRDYLRPAVPLPETLADLVKESASNGKEEGTIKSAVKAQRQRASLVSKSSPIIQ